MVDSCEFTRRKLASLSREKLEEFAYGMLGMICGTPDQGDLTIACAQFNLESNNVREDNVDSLRAALQMFGVLSRELKQEREAKNGVSQPRK